MKAFNILYDLTSLIILIILIVSLIGCRKYNEPQRYVIKEGNHKTSNRRSSKTISNEVRFTYTFTKNNRYVSELLPSDPINFQNKLYGLTSSKIHENSARISWRQIGSKFELLAYYYINCDMQYESMYFAESGEILEIIVTAGGGRYRFKINNIEIIINDTPKFKSRRAWPVFGGDPTCPHNMYFIITEF